MRADQVRKVIRALAGVALTAGVMIAPSLAAVDDLTACGKESGETAIAGCTSAIASGRYDGNSLSKLYTSRGVAYTNRDLDLAIADFNKAIEVDPTYVRAYNARGIAYSYKRDYDSAFADFDRAIGLDPNYARAYNARGSAYSAKKNYDRAFADYSKAIELDPKVAATYYNRGNVSWNKKDYDRAIADFTNAIEVDPKFARAYHTRGNANLVQRNYDRAIADYSKVIELDPKLAVDADAFRSRCFARAVAGRDLPRALDDCRESLRFRPNDAHTMDSRGLVYLRLGRLHEAIAEYDAVLKIDPNMASALYGRGIAKRRKGDASGGKADIEAARAVKADIAEVFDRYGVK